MLWYKLTALTKLPRDSSSILIYLTRAYMKYSHPTSTRQFYLWYSAIKSFIFEFIGAYYMYCDPLRAYQRNVSNFTLQNKTKLIHTAIACIHVITVYLGYDIWGALNFSVNNELYRCLCRLMCKLLHVERWSRHVLLYFTMCSSTNAKCWFCVVFMKEKSKNILYDLCYEYCTCKVCPMGL